MDHRSRDVGSAAPASVLVRAVRADEIDEVRALLREYEASLGVDLCFQGFQAELRGLPGDYAPPRGRLLVATVGGAVAGCVALRPLEGGACEMKRLYVRPRFRGLGAGAALARAIVEAARALGYARMRLDTLASMTAARAPYRELGFVPIDAYRGNPLEGALFMELALQGGS